jgi:membrane protein DedA with SNARE-associated domain
MDELATLVHHYGYWLIVFAAFFEGEGAVMAGGYAAHRGWLSWPLVAIAASGSALASSLCFYLLGRHFGPQLRRRHPALTEGWLPVIERWLERWSHSAIVGVRFAFWLRIPGLLLLGDAGIAFRRLAAFSLLAALLWGLAFTAVGWTCGAALAALSRDVRFAQQAGFALIVLIIVAFAVARHRLGARRKRRADDVTSSRGS